MSNSASNSLPDTTTPADPEAVQQITSWPEPVTLWTLVTWLFGSRRAILTLGANQATLWLGLLFVFSAALAREYDGEDLLREPWHLLLPLAASLVTSFLLFFLVSLVARHNELFWTGYWQRYRVFLGLYWMTAPLAWIYGIPVERFMSAGGSVAANMRFLALVSLWRVLLITRVLSVLFQTRAIVMFFLVMLFADSLALTLVSQVDVQIFAVMGGVRLTEAESVLAATKRAVLVLGIIGFPVWMIGTMVLLVMRTSGWTWVFAPTLSAQPSRRMSALVWAVPVFSIICWCSLLPWTQPAQQWRSAVDRDFRARRYKEMLATLSQHWPADFPPHWDPPPHIGTNRGRAKIVEIVKALSPETTAEVRNLYFDKLDAALGINNFPMDTVWLQTDPAEIIDVLEATPEGKRILKDHKDALKMLLEWGDKPQASREKIEKTLQRLTEVRSDATQD